MLLRKTISKSSRAVLLFDYAQTFTRFGVYEQQNIVSRAKSIASQSHLLNNVRAAPLLPVKYLTTRTFGTGCVLHATKVEKITVTFLKASGEKITAQGNVGDTLLDVVVNNTIDLDGFGACEGTLTCSTCHLIFKPQDYEKLPGKPGDEELDMLDLAYDLTNTSRLGCQITLTKDMDGLVVQVPATVNDVRSA